MKCARWTRACRFGRPPDEKVWEWGCFRDTCDILWEVRQGLHTRKSSREVKNDVKGPYIHASKHKAPFID